MNILRDIVTLIAEIVLNIMLVYLFSRFVNREISQKIYIRNRLIQNDMGMEKKAHIEKILINDPHTAYNWFQQYKKHPGQKEIERIYNDFNTIQNEQSKDIDIIPETKRC